MGKFNIQIMWDSIRIELAIITIIFIVLVVIRMISLSIKLKMVDKNIYKENYDKALVIIQKNKNSEINKKYTKLAFIKKEMIIYSFLNDRKKFDIAKEELGNSSIYKGLPEFWNIMFYFVNDKENSDLEKILEEYKIEYGYRMGAINYLNILNHIKNGNLEQARSDYQLITKKIKTKVLKKYIESILF